MKIISRLTVLLSLLSISLITQAQLRLPSLLSSNMVLQQNDSVWLWGLGDPAAKVFVTTSWNAHTDSAIVSNGAKWKLRIKTPAAGGPYTITFKQYSTVITLENVMLGEVWLCSGQSNMDWNYYVGVNDFQPELDLNRQYNIRFFYVAKNTSPFPQDDTGGEWAVCDSQRLKSFSAVAYFFAKKLEKQLHVPVGIIQASWGGTPAEVWTPEEIIKENVVLKKASEKIDSYQWWPKDPGVCYNAMLHPLIQYSIAGAIWYQGEGNTGNPATYSLLLTTMIDAWRKKWNKAIPFYFVQIAPFTYGAGYAGSIIREQQTIASKHSNTGMVVISDLVTDTTDIHPKNKKDVGARLANWALSETYHQSGIPHRHPQYSEMTIKGDKAYIRFTGTESGLVVKGKDVLALQMAGYDRVFYPAAAKIEKDVLVVSCSNVKIPAAVRFSFTNAGVGNLFNKDGLPVIPFRTDNWPIQ